jgi:hypothetical protein
VAKQGTLGWVWLLGKAQRQQAIGVKVCPLRALGLSSFFSADRYQRHLPSAGGRRWFPPQDGKCVCVCITEGQRASV